MLRMLALALLFLAASPVQAQLVSFTDPTVWVSAKTGFIMWTADPYSPSTDDLINGISVHVASRRWVLQLGYLESDRLQLDLSGLSLSRQSGSS